MSFSLLEAVVHWFSYSTYYAKSTGLWFSWNVTIDIAFFKTQLEAEMEEILLDWYRTNTRVLGIRSALLAECWASRQYWHTPFLFPERLFSTLWQERDIDSERAVWDVFQKVGDDFLIPRLWCRREDAVPLSGFLLDGRFCLGEVSGFDFKVERGAHLWCLLTWERDEALCHHSCFIMYCAKSSINREGRVPEVTVHSGLVQHLLKLFYLFIYFYSRTLVGIWCYWILDFKVKNWT